MGFGLPICGLRSFSNRLGFGNCPLLRSSFCEAPISSSTALLDSLISVASLISYNRRGFVDHRTPEPPTTDNFEELPPACHAQNHPCLTDSTLKKGSWIIDGGDWGGTRRCFSFGVLACSEQAFSLGFLLVPSRRYLIPCGP